MHLSPRPAAHGDFLDFFAACYHDARANEGLREAVRHEWDFLLRSPATLSLVVEDLNRPSASRLVGCAQLAFVTRAFVRLAREEPQPWTNARLTREPPDGVKFLLTPVQIAYANATEGLYALFTRWHRADRMLSPEQMLDVSDFMHGAFQAYAKGYYFREMLIEATGDIARDKGLRAGFYLRCDYGDYYRDHPPLPPSDVRPFLLGITRAEAVAREGGAMAHYFVHRAPRLGLTPGQQELLGLCLRQPELSDEALAATMGVKVHRVKNLLRATYGRISDVAFDLLPKIGDGKRGSEKKRSMLEYLREHPEELRPYRGKPSADACKKD